MGVHGQKHEGARVPISPGVRNVSQKRVEPIPGKKVRFDFLLSRRFPSSTTVSASLLPLDIPTVTIANFLSKYSEATKITFLLIR